MGGQALYILDIEFEIFLIFKKTMTRWKNYSESYNLL